MRDPSLVDGKPWALLFRVGTWAVVLLLPLLLVLVLAQRPQWNPSLPGPLQHVYIVSALAILALWAALLAAYATIQVREPRLLFLTLGFLSIGAIFAVHGLSTPGFVVEHDYSGTVGLSAHLALTLGAFFLFLSTVHPPPKLRTWISRHIGWLLAGALVLLVAYGAVGLGVPELFERQSLHRIPFSWAMTGVNLTLLMFTAYRMLASYLLSKLSLQASLFIGVIFLAESQIALQVPPIYSLAWWLYHVYLILGFAIMLYAVVTEYAGGRPIAAIFQELTPRDLAEQVKQGLEDSVVALAAAAEARDSYTYEHIGRVAELSVLIGQAIGLPKMRLRSLTQGAMLHDIGKLYISAAVLRKPDKLTPEEFEHVKQHPALGYQLLARLRGSWREALVIRHHHEWYNGSGYPDGLKGDEIPLEARIVAVADTYDALTTDRPYRPALSHQEAITIVQKEGGTHLDPSCVKAFMQVIDDWPRRQPLNT